MHSLTRGAPPTDLGSQLVEEEEGEDVTVDDAIDYIADNIENLCDIIESNVGITDSLS